MLYESPTYALLKQPPRAPARAYPKGVSCCGGACFDCTAIESGADGVGGRVESQNISKMRVPLASPKSKSKSESEL